jgi:hypothetical protein
MSTQRRENRWQRTGYTEGDGPIRQLLTDGVQRAGPPGLVVPGLTMPFACAIADGGTAPPGMPAWFHPSDEYMSPGSPVRFRPSDEDPSQGTPERLATNSLQRDYSIVQSIQIVQLVRLVSQHKRRGSPPFKADSSAATGIPATHGLFLSLNLSPSGFARFHPTLSRVPAGIGRWTERYDGKRNLHIQHAA